MSHFTLRTRIGLGAVALLTAGTVVGVAGVAGASRTGSPGNGRGAPPGPSTTGSSSSFLRQIADITFPAPYVNPASFDISYVDSTSQTYYLSDRTNDGIDAINAATDTFGSVIGAGDFTSTNTGTNVATAAQTAACGSSGTSGPNGNLSLTVDGVNQVVGGNGVSASEPVSAVKIFTLSTPTSGTLAATIPTAVAVNGTTGSCRADEMAYDPDDQLLLVANDLDSPPYVSLISMHANPSQDAIVGQIKFSNATDGIEQSVYDPQLKSFFVNIPGVEVAAIDPHSMQVSATYPTPTCTASGLALDEQTQDLLLSCGVNPDGVVFMDARNGQVVTRVPQVSGADEVWYDSGTNHYYLAASGMTSTGAPVPTVTLAGSGTSWTIAESGATGGTFTLTVGTATTVPIADNASASVVQAALASIVTGTTVTGGPFPATETVKFPATESTVTANTAWLTPTGYVTPVIGVIAGGTSTSVSRGNSGKSNGASAIQWIENVPEPTTEGSHSVAADPINGDVLFPLKGAGIAVFAWTS